MRDSYSSVNTQDLLDPKRRILTYEEIKPYLGVAL
jgi:hypothetical protein